MAPCGCDGEEATVLRAQQCSGAVEIGASRLLLRSTRLSTAPAAPNGRQASPARPESAIKWTAWPCSQHLPSSCRHPCCRSSALSLATTDCAVGVWGAAVRTACNAVSTNTAGPLPLRSMSIREVRSHEVCWHQSAAGGSGFRRALQGPQRRRVRPLRLRGVVTSELGLLYSSSTGHTRKVAYLVKQCLGKAVSQPIEVSTLTASHLAAWKDDGLIVGTPTWATAAEDHRSGTAMDDLLWQVRQTALDGDSLALRGTRFAVFGCGDSKQWPDNFVDAMEEVHTTLVRAGASPVGTWKPPQDLGYTFTVSKSFRRATGEFVGLAVDDINQPELTAARVYRWCSQLCQELGLDGASLTEPRAECVPPLEAPVEELPYPYHAKANWMYSAGSKPTMLFGTRMTSTWYQMGGGSGAAGRWLKFMDSHLLMRAGLRGQPEYQIEYRDITGAEVCVQTSSVTEGVTLLLHLDGMRQTRRPWASTVVLRGLEESEVPGLLSFLVDRGSRLTLQSS